MASIAYGPMISNARGKVGGVVFSRGRSTATTRVRVKPRNPNSTAQSAIRAALTAASRAYKALSSTNLALWAGYASGITKHNPVSGTAYHPAGIDAFTALATKFLQVTPGGSIPVTPPTSAFSGDATVITPTAGAGQISFAASADQGAGITTDLLLQKLASPARTPSPTGYVHKAFWTADSMTPLVVTGLTPGTYAVAYKFAKTATGQQSGLVTLGKFTVT